MMRSLFSGVAGLKTHQTKMDVIGNNIANVNTVGFKSSNVNFADTFYQTISGASGPSAVSGAAGTNAKQIGLGSNVASITTNITEAGGTSTTNRALDVAINGDSFLVVKSGGATYFTKSGALNVDEAGNLYCTTNGATVQGWMADSTGEVKADTVTDIKVMTPEQMYIEPTATSNITLKGNIDRDDKQLVSSATDGNADKLTGGRPMTFSFYDNLGQLYSAKLYVTKSNADGQDANSATADFTVRVGDVYDEEGNSIFVKKEVDPDTGTVTYSASGSEVMFGGQQVAVDGDVNPTTGEFTLSGQTATLQFNNSTGEFAKVTTGEDRTNAELNGKSINFSISKYNGEEGANTTFPQHDEATDTGGVELDFSNLSDFSKGGESSTTYARGDVDSKGAGNKAGNMKGISIDGTTGKIYGTYDNGEKKCLAQIAVTTFSNPSGLEAVGDSMFAATLNSGSFDGVGQSIEITGSFKVGALEMSNVDLASEFTQMITTQRGFQANSRIITTSDSMLEELVNLKR